MYVEKSSQDVAISDTSYIGRFLNKNPPAARKAKIRRGYQSDLQRDAARLFARKKTECKKSGINFDLSPEWFETKLTCGKCEQTGIPFERGNGSYHPWNFTVDCIDHTKGYTPDNCQAVCWCYNAAKSMGTDRDVMRMARALVLAIRD